jgi:hypothetical protein
MSNNYEFRIISSSNPIQIHNQNMLHTNYTLLSNPKMARRIKEFNNQTDELPKSFRDTLNMLNNNPTQYFSTVKLTLKLSDSGSQYLSGYLGDYLNSSNILTELLVAINLTTHKSDDSITIDNFVIQYSFLTGFIIVENKDPSFDYDNYDLIFKYESYLQGNIVKTYVLNFIHNT